jgi:hypothetical protein
VHVTDLVHISPYGGNKIMFLYKCFCFVIDASYSPPSESSVNSIAIDEEEESESESEKDDDNLTILELLSHYDVVNVLQYCMVYS